MTKPRAQTDMIRPRRRWGDILRETEIIRCPINHPPAPLRVVAYRTRTIRLECPSCGLRFSVDGNQLQKSIDASGTFNATMALVIWNRDKD